MRVNTRIIATGADRPKFHIIDSPQRHYEVFQDMFLFFFLSPGSEPASGCRDK